MDNVTTTTQINHPVAMFYNRVLLKAATPALLHNRFAQMSMIPPGEGVTAKWRRYNNYAAATTPLTEGQEPAAQQQSKVDLTAICSQYGGWTAISDVVDLTNPDKNVVVEKELQGNQFGLTIDTLTRDVLMAAASMSSATGGTNGKTPTEISQTDVDSVVKTLFGNNAREVTKVLAAGTGIGTMPVRRSFFGIAHTDMMDAIKGCEEFTHYAEYPSQSGIMDDEFGQTGGIRWCLSTNADKVLNTTPTPDQYEYRLAVIGADAYGTVGISTGTMQNIVKPNQGHLNQYTSVGWKTWHVARILNDSNLHLLKCTNKQGS